MRFRLEVVHGRAAPQSIELEAANCEQARQLAAARGYTVLVAQPQGFVWLRLLSSSPTSPARFDVPVFIEQLRDLLAAGLSVVEALNTLQQAVDERSRPLLAAVIRRLQGGERFSQALAAEPRFPALLVSLVSASELTSDLPQALTRFLEHEQRVAELRHRISSVAIYPLMLTGVGTAVLFFLLLYVMPRFARVFEGMNGPLPWSASAMVWWAQWLGAHGPMLYGVGLAVLGLLLGAALSPATRGQALRLLLERTPLRTRLRTYFLARWYRATGMLVEGGIPLPEALQLSNPLLPVGLHEGGAAVERSLREGLSPAQAHLRAGMATAVAEQLMRAGERTGELGAVLVRIAQFHEAEATRSLERGMRALEPLVMVLIGLGVGTVVVLMYLPIFELAAAIQ